MEGFNVYASKLKRLLFAFALLALSFVVASAQPRSNGAASQPEQAGDFSVLVTHLPDWGNALVHEVSVADSTKTLEALKQFETVAESQQYFAKE